MVLTKIMALIKLRSRDSRLLSANSAGVDVTYNMTLISVKIANSSLTFPQSRSNTTEQLLVSQSSCTMYANKKTKSGFTSWGNPEKDPYPFQNRYEYHAHCYFQAPKYFQTVKKNEKINSGCLLRPKVIFSSHSSIDPTFTDCDQQSCLPHNISKTIMIMLIIILKSCSCSVTNNYTL